MKRCPECRRDYYDDTLLYCLDDGNALLEGPATASGDEPATAILHATGAPGDAPTRAQIQMTDQTAILPSDILPISRGFDKRLLVVPILLVIIAFGGFFGYRYITPAKQIDSIAVMPFVNESGNADVEYLSDGMTETLISSLSQLANLNVKGRSSVFRYKGKDVDTKTLAKELGVQAVLYGRVIQRGEQLTLSLELLDALTENVIWSAKYDRKQADVVSLQSEIARDVSNKLKTKLSGADVAKVEKGYTVNPEAYRLYLQGRFYWNKRTPADLKKSIEYFDQAIAIDPGYALAYSGLADVYQVLPGYTSDPPPGVAYPKARAAAQTALEIDPNMAEPHAALAVVLHEYEWNHPEAEKEYKRAIELDPKYPSAHQWYGNFLLDMGRFQEGVPELERAIELDPFSPVINANLGRAYRASRRYDDAITQYKKTLEIAPNFGIAQFNLSRTYFAAGMYEQGIEFDRQVRLSQGDPAEQVETEAAGARDAYRRGGERGFWQFMLEMSEKAARDTNREILPYPLARLQLGTGNKDDALDSLEKAVAAGRGKPDSVWLKAEPMWDPLRSEPRFKELLRKVGLPE